MSYSLKSVKRELNAIAEKLSTRERPAHVRELAGESLVVVAGESWDYAYALHEARKLAEGKAAVPTAWTEIATVYYARTERHLAGTDGKPVLSDMQIDAIRALMRWA